MDIDIEQRVFELGQEGYCCSQIIIKIGMELREMNDEVLIQAMSGLCYGLHNQQICGSLNAGACLMALYDKENTAELVKELYEWFKDRFGCVCCAELIGIRKKDFQKCLEITSETCMFCFQILEEKGLIE